MLDPTPVDSSHDDQNVIHPTSRILKLRWDNPRDDVLYLQEGTRERERQVLRILDDNGFNIRVFLVAASGFLATSYSLFSTNVVLPAIAFIYPAKTSFGELSNHVIDFLTLIGTILGMLVMGHLADRAGRKRLYGLELAVLIVSTMGIVQASSGFNFGTDSNHQSSMDIYAWLAWWRIAVGFGIGAEYPISAIITAEWASTESRGTMLASVKSMQSVARVLAVGIGLGALRDVSRRNGLETETLIESDKTKLVLDQVWRLVTGVALIPAFLAIIARLTIPETPRFYNDIRKDLRQAVKNALQVYKQKDDHVIPSSGGQPVDQNSDGENNWFLGAWAYLQRDSREALRRLVTISLLWALMDIGFYGLSLDSPSALATLANRPITQPENPRWRPESEPNSTSIYHVLENNSSRSLLIISISSILGSFTAVLMVNYFRRRMILITCFLLLAVLFAITGGTLLQSSRNGADQTPAIVFYGITQFVYNAGPNTMIFIMAAEMFPTVYRGTFYGIAAAAGKVGALIIRGVIWSKGNKHEELSIRILVFVPIMLLAALVSWFLPDVQYLPTTGSNTEAEAEPEPPIVDTLETGANYQRSPENGGASGLQDEETAMADAALDRQASHQSSSTDTNSSRTTENAPRRTTAQNNLRLLPRLTNMTLEQIAPNPRSREKKPRKESVATTNEKTVGLTTVQMQGAGAL